MNKVIFLLCTIFLIFSCEPNQHIISINKNESGFLESSFDFSKSVGLFLQAAKEQADQDSTKAMAYTLIAGLYQAENKDSVFNLYERLPDSLKMTLDSPELLKNVSLIAGSNLKEQSSGVSIKVVFKNEKKLHETFAQLEYLEEAAKRDSVMTRKFATTKEFFPKYSIDMDARTIRLPHSDLVKKMVRDTTFIKMFEKFGPDDNRSAQGLKMLEMLFGGSITTIVYAPGEIIFSNDPNAVIEGNKIIFEASKIEILQTKDTLDRILKFKY